MGVALYAGARTDMTIYYHFTGKTLRDGKPIPAIGEWLVGGE